MKTPCLKCGLIHEEPTAICEGYVGLDPNETAGDSRKQAAARIRAILSAVPIEKRPEGRSGKRRSESNSAVAEMKPLDERSAHHAAAAPAADRSTERAEAEVPEWRREVSERLESYRQRREKQTRGVGAGQSVLEFRVHSKKELDTGDAVTTEAGPAEGNGRRMPPSAMEELMARRAAAAEESTVALDSGLEQCMARVEAAAADTVVLDAPVQELALSSEAAALEPVAAIPQAMAAAAGAGAGNGAAAARGIVSATTRERVYAPADSRGQEHESASFDAPVRDFEELAYPTAEKEAETFIPEAQDAAATELTRDPARKLPEDHVMSAEITSEPRVSLPLASEPAMVLAEPSTLEVHADAMDLEETVRIEPVIPPVIVPEIAAAGSEVVPAVQPLFSIPPIDDEYWRTAPVIQPDLSLGIDNEECGSLTSSFDMPAAIEAALAPETIVEEAAADREATKPAGDYWQEPSQEMAAAPAEVAPLLKSDSEAASEAMAGIGSPAGALLAGPSEDEESETADPRREALRTASRRASAPAERIEITVPQPVFDFSPASALPEHPQDQQIPVADLRERRSAGALDAAVLAFTVAGFFFAFHLAGGELPFSRAGAAVVLAATFLIFAQYFLLFTITAGATPGMMLRGLRVVCFDGTPPGSLELVWRAFGAVLSAAAGMLGFIWAAWDEDGLTWHDRISQTYITYAEVEPLPVHAPVQ